MSHVTHGRCRHAGARPCPQSLFALLPAAARRGHGAAEHQGRDRARRTAGCRTPTQPTKAQVEHGRGLSLPVPASQHDPAAIGLDR